MDVLPGLGFGDGGERSCNGTSAGRCGVRWVNTRKESKIRNERMRQGLEIARMS